MEGPVARVRAILRSIAGERPVRARGGGGEWTLRLSLLVCPTHALLLSTHRPSELCAPLFSPPPPPTTPAPRTTSPASCLPSGERPPPNPAHRSRLRRRCRPGRQRASGSALSRAD